MRRRAARPQGLLRSRVVPADRPMDLTARAGLVVVAETLLALGLDEVVRRELRVRRRQRGLEEFDKVQAAVLLLAAGGERAEDVRLLREDKALGRLLERPLPSPDALLDFLGAFHDDKEMARRPAEGAFIPRENGALAALARVNAELNEGRFAAVSAPSPTTSVDVVVVVVVVVDLDGDIYVEVGDPPLTQPSALGRRYLRHVELPAPRRVPARHRVPCPRLRDRRGGAPRARRAL